uniref:Protein FYV4, mitochondrial n=1 Tax=Syphacia muris TaxID=451379 RepID=A0A0N5ASC8_9BILA
MSSQGIQCQRRATCSQMYKVGHSPVSRSATFAIHNIRSISSRPDIYDKHGLEQLLAEDPPFNFQTEIPLPVFSKKTRRNVVPVENHKDDSGTIEYLNNAWKAFVTRDGAPDNSIVRFKPKKDERYKSTNFEDFIPFDVEKYHAERVLRAYNIDPKIVDRSV